MAHNPEKLRRGRRKWFFAGTLTFLLGLGVWQYWINVSPGYDIPWPKIPERNAFDIYVAAGKVLSQQHSISSTADGFMYVTSANGELTENTRPSTSADRRAVLKANAISLELLRQGFQLPYHEPAARSRDFTIPYLTHFIHLANLLIIRGREYESRRDWNRAANEYLTAIKFGAEVSDHATIIDSWQAGLTCEFLGRAGLWRIIDHLKTDDLKRVTKHLQAREQQRTSLSEIFVGQSYYVQACLYETFQEHDWARQISYSFDYDISSTDWLKVMRLQFIGKRGFYDNFIRAMNAAVHETQKAYLIRQWPKNHEDISFSHQLDFPRYSFYDARMRAAHDLTLVAFSLHAYKLDGGEFPEELDQLVPKYLNHIPADAFGSGEKLRYRKSGTRYLLYSIGPDGVDDRGETLFEKRAREKYFGVSIDSKGDFIAGINH